jgi:DNA-binding XRE family transcriptional regulator
MTNAQVAEAVVGPQWSWGDRLRKIRRVAGMQQADMAFLVGVPTQTFGTWEANRALPQRMVMELVSSKIAARFPKTVSAAWLMGYGADGPLPTTPHGEVSGPDAQLYVIGKHEEPSLPRMDSNHQPCDLRFDAVQDAFSTRFLVLGLGT